MVSEDCGTSPLSKDPKGVFHISLALVSPAPHAPGRGAGLSGGVQTINNTPPEQVMRSDDASQSPTCLSPRYTPPSPDDWWVPDVLPSVPTPGTTHSDISGMLPWPLDAGVVPFQMSVKVRDRVAQGQGKIFVFFMQC
uniref:Uncharacterized protein n=1 Tax=Knipowitschia caucasica TaxID=637954 RepID=A0AAV2L254_KNICA